MKPAASYIRPGGCLAVRPWRWGAVGSLAPFLVGLVILCLLLDAGGPSVADPFETIRSSDAQQFIGQEKIAEGRVTAAERDGNTVRLHLGDAPQDLSVALLLSWLNAFPPASERQYLGKTVRVTGVIRSFRGTPEIVVRDAAAIQIMDTEADAGAAAENRAPVAQAAPTDDAVLRGRVEALNQRVRVLEERVRQLEQAVMPKP